MRKLLVIIVLLTTVCSCVRKVGKVEGTPQPLQYAKGFTVKVRLSI